MILYTKCNFRTRKSDKIRGHPLFDFFKTFKVAVGDDAKKKRVQKRLPLDFFSTRNFVSEKEKPKKKNFQKILKTNMYPPKKNDSAAPEKQGLNNLL